MTTIRKTISGAVAALALTATVAASATPAAADWRGHHGYYRGGNGGAVAAGIIGGLALGALAVGATRSAPRAYAYEPVYGGCVNENQPTYDRWGRFLGYQAVTVCD